MHIPQIIKDERAKREAAIKCGRGSVRLEGFILSDQAESLFAQYINGDLTRQQLNAAVLKLAGSFAN